MTTHTDHDTHEHPGLEEPRPGQELRAARERAGISREFMAERLRLAVTQFDALEHDDYAELPPPAFVRGYFRAYARELGLDADGYIAAYNRSGVSGRDPEIRSGGITDTSSGGRGGMIGLLLIALVAAGGIGAWWYQQRMMDGGGGNGATDSVQEERAGTDDREPQTRDPQDTGGGDMDTGDSGSGTDGGDNGAASGEGDRDADTASSTATADDGAEAASMDVDAADGTDDDAAADAGEAEAEDGGAADDGEAADDEVEQPIVATPDRESLASGGDDATGDGTEVADAGDAASGSRMEEAAEADAATAEEDGEGDGSRSTADNGPGATSPAATDSPTGAATDAAGSGPDQLALEFAARSWLEVYDDRDRELAYTLYFGSEPITLRGWAPFEIFLGNSPAVDVRLNGEEIDKSAFTRSNNTARFVVDASGIRAP